MLKRILSLALMVCLVMSAAPALAGSSALDYYKQANVMRFDFQKQVELYTKAIDLAPDWASAYNNRGVAYFNLGNWDAAIADFTKAIELKPDYKLAIANRAGANFNKENAAKDWWDDSYQDRVEAGF